MTGTRFWSYPRLIAHRAGGVLAPENTLSGFELARRLGCQMVEIDAMLTRDGVPILSHDEELGRAILGEGKVADRTYAEMRQLDAGVRFGRRFQGERVCRLDEAIAWSISNAMVLNIEIKPSSGQDRGTARAVARLVTQHYAKSASPLPLISSFSIDALQEMRACAPIFPRAVLFDRLPDDWVRIARSLEVVAVHPNYRVTTEAMVETAHANGWGVMCYTVDDTQTASDLLTMGVDAVCTNRMDVLRSIVVD